MKAYSSSCSCTASKRRVVSSIRSLLLTAGVLGFISCPRLVFGLDEKCPCYNPVTLPNIESFESEEICQLNDSCADECPLQGSWSNMERPDDWIDWLIHAGPTMTTGTGPNRDATSGVGKFAYVESSCEAIGYADKPAALLSPCFNLSGIPAAEFEFAYHMFGADMGDLNIDVSTDGCNNWTTIDTISGQQQASASAPWRRKLVNLIPYAKKNHLRIRLQGVTGPSYLSDIAVDDLTMRAAKCCDLAVTAVEAPGSRCSMGSQEQVAVRIQNLGYEDKSNFGISYRIDDGPIVSEIFTDQILAGGSYLYTFSTPADLSDPGEHVLTVTVNLDGDLRFENDTLSHTFWHLPTITQYPYVQDFENGKAGWLSGGINNTWALGTPNKRVIKGAASGVNSWTTGGLEGVYRNNEQSSLTGPCFDFSNLSLPSISMQAW